MIPEVTRGKQIGAQIHTVAGDNGVGKTTFVASFPSVLIIDLENGSKHLDVSRISAEKVPDLAAFRALIKALKTTPHEYKTLAIDSVESLESLIFTSVCAEAHVASIEDVGGGYGKGYVRSREIMTEIMQDLQALQNMGITSILNAHTQIKSKTDPATNLTYDRVIMRCNDKMAAIVRDLSDNIFYATYKVFTTKENNKTKAYGDGQRVMYTQPRPGFDAKNRLELPLELPLSYDAFVEACGQGGARPELLVEEIKQMSHGLDEKLKADVAAMLEKHKANSSKLKEIKNRLMKYVAA